MKFLFLLFFCVLCKAGEHNFDFQSVRYVRPNFSKIDLEVSNMDSSSVLFTYSAMALDYYKVPSDSYVQISIQSKTLELPASINTKLPFSYYASRGGDYIDSCPNYNQNLQILSELVSSSRCNTIIRYQLIDKASSALITTGYLTWQDFTLKSSINLDFNISSLYQISIGDQIIERDPTIESQLNWVFYKWNTVEYVDNSNIFATYFQPLSVQATLVATFARSNISWETVARVFRMYNRYGIPIRVDVYSSEEMEVESLLWSTTIDNDNVATIYETKNRRTIYYRVFANNEPIYRNTIRAEPVQRNRGSPVPSNLNWRRRKDTPESILERTVTTTPHNTLEYYATFSL